MSIELSIKDKLNFENIDLVAPEIVAKEVTDQIGEITDGLVKGVVAPYSGYIESYTTRGLEGLQALKAEVKHDVQENLGAIGYDYSKFELYITATMLPQYKFRVLFFGYGIGGYPVKVVLEEGIANAMSGGKYTYSVKNREKLEEILNRALSSSKSVEVIQGLINATKIAQSRGETGEADEIENEIAEE